MFPSKTTAYLVGMRMLRVHHNFIFLFLSIDMIFLKSIFFEPSRFDAVFFAIYGR
jgi:hypothetical protein